MESKIPDVNSLATKIALSTVENKIPDVSSLIKKTNYDTKITEIEKKLNDHNHDKYMTTPEFNTLTVDVFNARLAQVNLVTLMLNCQVLIEKLLKIKQSTCLLKMS